MKTLRLTLLSALFAVVLCGASLPQEKVYLHFDNSSYYYGDNIWFNAYVVRADGNIVSGISRPLYVDLLTQEGEIVDTRTLRIDDNGRCHGDFRIDRVPFYPGFYEVRAYTKYMLNFGDDAVFSRIFPIFERPEREGDYKSRILKKRGKERLVKKRKMPKKQDRLNVRFYPESGNLVKGIRSRIAFEATDNHGFPVSVTGKVEGDTTEIATRHEGKGTFFSVPGDNPANVMFTFEGKDYTFTLPHAVDYGCVMTVDNLSSRDSLTVEIAVSDSVPTGNLGLAILSGGMLRESTPVNMNGRHTASMTFEKSRMLPGVSHVALIDSNGDILCDRPVFVRGGKELSVKVIPDKSAYSPFEQINLDIRIQRPDSMPFTDPFSLSVRDGDDEVTYERSILTDLLLMSEIKGYVAHPYYYFEQDDSIRRDALDLLLMVQGWRRYTNNLHLIDKNATQPEYTAEKSGIVTSGRVVSSVRKIPKPNVDLSIFLLKRNEDNESGASAIDLLTTDSLGKFAFVSDIEGRWNLVLSVKEKGKKKDYSIILDRNFRPAPKPYRFADLEFTTAQPATPSPEADNSANFTVDIAPNDSAFTGRHSITEMQHLSEVTVKARKNSKERDIYRARSKSIAYYDVASGLDDIRDAGEYIGGDIHLFLRELNKNFTRTIVNGEDYLLYKGRLPLFVINYQRNYGTKLDYDRYKYIRLEAIKSLYISEDPLTMLEYANPGFDVMSIDKTYGCAVFVEIYPEGEIPVDAGKGVRKTRLDGYDPPEMFCSPDYSIIEPEPDYRRTLYWNPEVMPDADGHARVTLYNNSSCRSISVNLETVTPDGLIGVMR